jgi:asparagine N-glycosylation enzyme membrane subunit Stt3
VALIALWFLPEYFGSGDFFRAAARAHDPNPDSAAFAKHPFLEVFNRSASILTWPVYAGGVIAVVIAARRPREHLIPLAMAAISTILMVSVAAMTQLGFAGNLRYVALPAAFVCVLAGAGWVWLVRATNARFGTVAAAALTLLVAAAAFPSVNADINELKIGKQLLDEEAQLYGTVPDAIRAGGGEAKLKSCGTIYTGNFQTQTIAWYLHIHEVDSEIFGYPPGTIIAPTYSYLSRDPRFPVFARYGHWVIGSSCRR